MKDDIGEYVWRTIRGRRIKIYLNKSLKESFNLQKNQNVKKLDVKEYDKLKNDFEKKLTKKEKEKIEEYLSYGGASQYLNDRKNDNWKQTYRFIDKTNKKGYVEKQLNDLEAFNTQLDREALNIKTNIDTNGMLNHDDIIKSNYERIQRFHDDINVMDKIFKEKGVSLDKDIVVYRKGHESLEDLQNGVVRYGYTSTSAMSRINKKTPGGLILGSNEFEIIVPKGMKFLPIENIAQKDLLRQHEILLPRNIKFELIQDKSKKAKFDINKKNLWTKGENRYLVRAKEVK